MPRYLLDQCNVRPLEPDVAHHPLHQDAEQPVDLVVGAFLDSWPVEQQAVPAVVEGRIEVFPDEISAFKEQRGDQPRAAAPHAADDDRVVMLP